MDSTHNIIQLYYNYVIIDYYVLEQFSFVQINQLLMLLQMLRMSNIFIKAGQVGKMISNFTKILRLQNIQE